jgi:rhodanese-related sulfurtransferase
MTKILKLNSAQMVANARTLIEEIAAEDALAFVGNDDVVFIDIRDVRERQNSGYIPGSFHAPRGLLEFWVDPESPYFKPVFGENKKYILHCAAGWRSALATASLQHMGFEAAHITDGFASWEKAGGPIEFDDDAKKKATK